MAVVHTSPSSGGQLEQEPPQSIPISFPFCIPSLQSVLQSGQLLPPQSTPNSSPFCIPSDQVVAFPIVLQPFELSILERALFPSNKDRILNLCPLVNKFIQASWE